MLSFEHDIQTKRLVLKPMSVEYLDSTHEYASDPENTKHMIFLPNDTIEETLAYLKNAETEWQKDSPAFYEFAVHRLGLRHFTAHCDSENAASRRVMEKLGMAFMDEYGGRKNKQSTEERSECLYVLDISE